MIERNVTLNYTGIRDDIPTIKSHEQYGLVTPDGTIQWVTLSLEGTKLDIESMATSDKTHPHSQRFVRNVTQRCEGLGISAEEYLDNVKFIKRTIVLSVLSPEPVKHPWKAPAQDVPF